MLSPPNCTGLVSVRFCWTNSLHRFSLITARTRCSDSSDSSAFCVLRSAFLPESVIPCVLAKLFPFSGMSRHRKPPNISKVLKEAECGHMGSQIQSVSPQKSLICLWNPQKTTAQNGMGLGLPDKAMASGPPAHSHKASETWRQEMYGRAGKEQETVTTCGKTTFSAKVRCTMLSRFPLETNWAW